MKHSYIHNEANLNILGGGGKLSHPTQNLVKITFYKTLNSLRHDKYLKFQFKILNNIFFDE